MYVNAKYTVAILYCLGISSLEYSFLHIFDPLLVDSMDAEPTDEGQLYRHLRSLSPLWEWGRDRENDINY